MLINTNKKLSPVFLEGKESYASEFIIYSCKKRKLIQKWITQLLIEENHAVAYKKMTKKSFSNVKDFFYHEPYMFSHLQIGDNIFCYLDKGQLMFINLRFNGKNIAEDAIVKRRYSTSNTFFWLFGILGEELKN